MATTATPAAKKGSAPKATKKVAKTYTFDLPDVKEFLKAGVQFGHQSKKWNPKMQKFIFGKREQIHIIDISKSLPALEAAMQFLAQAASDGEVMFVGTKRQASDIVRDVAIDAGAYFITHRWPGGLLTNFDMIRQSLKRFNGLEQEFSTGVEGRTKFEISQMKKDWEKMNRLYEGMKTMTKYPKAIVIVDTKFEKNAVSEARAMGIPIVGLVDTNCDPEDVDFAIPANDDAIGSISLLVGLLGQAVKKGNEGKGIKHDLVDYSTYEVKIVKSAQEDSERVEVAATPEVKQRDAKAEIPSKSRTAGSKGMLEDIQKTRETAKRKQASSARKK
ncbi:MAG: 30S ribosomal protein S2 [candidate division WS6 bacterium OLB20]|uniref:Small ribosomal subunit protein uS2 n=1 Tax=candidate division WS6 bacterium OLB20 TaxID=1617426 RepID=A0A136LYI1_9BACT|nr:MAG: 30S ribosomal protein S2 [candidate division WS6 bacterium OLB20]